MPIPVVITVYQDKSFTFTTKTAPVSFFLKAAGLPKGGQEPSCCWAGDDGAGARLRIRNGRHERC